MLQGVTMAQYMDGVFACCLLIALIHWVRLPRMQARTRDHRRWDLVFSAVAASRSALCIGVAAALVTSAGPTPPRPQWVGPWLLLFPVEVAALAALLIWLAVEVVRSIRARRTT